MSKKKHQIQEPTPKNSLDEKEYESEVYAAYSAYKSLSGSREHKRWILEYAKSIGKDASLYSRGRIKDYSPHGIWARMITRGITIPEKEKEGLDSLLDKLQSKNLEYTESRQNAICERNKKHNIQMIDVLTNINVCVDQLSDHVISKKKNQFSIDSTFSNISVPASVYSSVIQHLDNKLYEMYMARDKTDEQLVEGYSFLSKTQLKKYIEYLEEIVDFYKNKSQSNKKSRKPRTKKRKTPEQLTKGVKYLEKDESGSIVSVNPTSVVGSTGVVILNTKTKTLIIYLAKEGETLSFKGTTILNIHESKSKKIRNYEKLISDKSLICLTFAHAVNLYSSLKTKEYKPKDRININSIILAVKK